SSATIDNNIIINNSATSGGGIYSNPICCSPKPTIIISNNVISNNKATNHGGGISSTSTSYTSLTITKNKISGNYSGDEGGGISFYSSTYVYNSVQDISNNTFTDNEAKSLIYITGGADLTINQSNIINNDVTYDIKNDFSGSITAENNYWDLTTESDIKTKIYDWFNESSKGVVDYTPFLSTPNTDAPPIPPQNLKLNSQTVNSATFTWDASKMGDLAGYKFYYDTDSSGYPYANSVDLGNVVTKSLTGLSVGTKYYVSVSTYDSDGNESWYSKEVSVTMNSTPVIAAVSDVTIKEDETATVTLSAT
ncbi:uncharacterized protein METZ01_LOCUS367104, partial [marine metagenome]